MFSTAVFARAEVVRLDCRTDFKSLRVPTKWFTQAYVSGDQDLFEPHGRHNKMQAIAVSRATHVGTMP